MSDNICPILAKLSNIGKKVIGFSFDNELYVGSRDVYLIAAYCISVSVHIGIGNCLDNGGISDIG